MNEINFLPVWYQQKRARRRNVIVQGSIIVAVAATLLTWTFTIRTAAGIRAEQAQTIESQRSAARLAIEERDRLHAERRTLTHQLAMQRELVQSINQTQIMAAMSQLIPPSVAITELRVAVHRRAPEPYRSAAAKEEQARRDAVRPPQDAVPPAPQYVQISVMGVAAEDDDLADFLGDLTRHPVFTNVKMQYSRTVEFLNLRGRDFRMSAEVPLDARYRPVGEEVADAH